MDQPAQSRIVLVLTTLDEQTDASAFARTLVEEGLAACANVLPPMTSIYRWKGAVETATERQVLLKTTREGVAALEKRIRELHPYEVPEIIVLPVLDAGTEYEAWVVGSVGDRRA